MDWVDGKWGGYMVEVGERSGTGKGKGHGEVC